MGFKNYSNGNEPTYKVLKVFGQLDSDSSKPKELRLIQWGKNAPKYDLRGWGTDENGNVLWARRIYTVEEAAKATNGKNTFSIRYR